MMLRFALCCATPCVPADLFANVDDRINFAARRIGGLNRCACIESLNFLSGTWSFANCYTQHWAYLLDPRLRENNSAARRRLQIDQRRCFSVDTGRITYTSTDISYEA